jgi:hypothetical protein
MKNKTIFGALAAASLMAFGAAAQAQGVPPRGDLDRDGIINMRDSDRDGDGILNARDPNPNVPNVVRMARNNTGPYGDLDRDGIQNRVDRDRDGDGVRNERDRFPDNVRRS